MTKKKVTGRVAPLIKTAIIYQTKSGALELKGDFTRETVWANRMQMAEIFNVNTPAISKHIKNIYKEKELSEKATSSKRRRKNNCP